MTQPLDLIIGKYGLLREVGSLTEGVLATRSSWCCQAPDELDGPWPSVRARRLVRNLICDRGRQKACWQLRKQVSDGMASLGVLQDRVTMRVTVFPQAL